MHVTFLFIIEGTNETGNDDKETKTAEDKDEEEEKEDERVAVLALSLRNIYDYSRRSLLPGSTHVLVGSTANHKCNAYPLQHLFDTPAAEEETSSSDAQHAYLLRSFANYHFLKYALVLWSHLVDVARHRARASLGRTMKSMHELVERLVADLLRVVNTCHCRFMAAQPALTNCMLAVMLERSSPPPSGSSSGSRRNRSMLGLAYALKLASLFAALDLAPHNKKRSSKLSTDLLLAGVERLQTLALLLLKPSEESDENGDLLVDMLVASDGHMSNNAYVACLLDWLDLCAFESDQDQGESEMFNTARCLALNALGDIFHTLCGVRNTKWHMPSFSSAVGSSNLSRLNKSTCRLLNVLVITKLRPCVARNRAYFALIDKLKAIKAHIEHVCAAHATALLALATTTIDKEKEKEKEKDKEASSKRTTPVATSTSAAAALAASRTSYYAKVCFVNALVDSFRLHVDKTLDLFFLVCRHQHYQQQQQQQQQAVNNKINYLNASISQLRLMRNLIIASADEMSCSLSARFNAKLYLGQLVARNVAAILLKCLAKITDHLAFYSYSTSTQRQQQQVS